MSEPAMIYVVGYDSFLNAMYDDKRWHGALYMNWGSPLLIMGKLTKAFEYMKQLNESDPWIASRSAARERKFISARALVAAIQCFGSSSQGETPEPVSSSPETPTKADLDSRLLVEWVYVIDTVTRQLNAYQTTRWSREISKVTLSHGHCTDFPAAVSRDYGFKDVQETRAKAAELMAGIEAMGWKVCRHEDRLGRLMRPEPDVTKKPQVQQPSSWVIRSKETGEAVLETFDPRKVAALKTPKYEAVPIQEHLAGLSGR